MKKRFINKTAISAIVYDYLTTLDGGPGSGNFGHSGRPGKVGGSGGGKGGLGKVSGTLGKTNEITKKREVYGSLKARGYSLTSSNVGRSKGRDRVFISRGKPTANLPKGSGTTYIAESDLSKNVHSCVKYLTPDGGLTAERERLHAKLVNDVFKGKKPVAPGEEKTFFVLGGGPASGKGSLTAKETHAEFGVPSKDEQATIDADEFKKGLPEYDIENRKAAAAFCHEESSSLTKRAMSAAFKNNYNCTLDGTGDGSLNSMRKKINEARKNGYKVEAAYVTCPTEMAVERAKKRAEKTGRDVPEQQVRRTHAAVSRIFPQIASEFDHVTLWDTGGPKGSKPKKIAECWRGEPIKIIDNDAYQAFLDKGK